MLLGSNMGNSRETLRQARSMIGREIGHLTDLSGLYKTAPWKMEDGSPWFFNQVVKVDTAFTPYKLLEKIRIIEAALGRIRTANNRYISRTIDLDILYIADETIDTPELKVPHPLLHERKFSLLPLCEIAPAFIHPILKKTNAELLTLCRDQSEVLRMNEVDI